MPCPRDPAGTSVQNMAHWSQAVRNPERVMPKFDYGTSCTSWLGLPRDCNQRKYGSLEPPQYNLTAITTPLALFTGGGRPGAQGLLLLGTCWGQVLGASWPGGCWLLPASPLLILLARGPQPEPGPEGCRQLPACTCDRKECKQRHT